jgi:cephalosporin hydroxylase
MKHTTRLRIARMVRLIRPPAEKLPLSVHDVLSGTESLDSVERFNKLYYESGVSGTLNWRGIPMIKNPCDLWMMLELLQSVKPSVLIETGTHHGASALYFSEMMKLLGSPLTVITIDINPKWHCDPKEFGIESIVGYSTDERVVRRVRASVESALQQIPGPVMATLDSDHSAENVARELELYSPLITPNSYLVVEDTNVNGHPAAADHGPGPWEAVLQFLATHREFVQDQTCERYLLTFFPGGWLKRVA